MSTARQSMHIRLDAEQTAQLLAWAGRRTEAEFDADIEPSGYTLEIGVTSFAHFVEAVSGNDRLDLGFAEVKLIDEPAAD